MRLGVDSKKIEQLMKALGREAKGSGCVYFTGGASALLVGWRGYERDISDVRAMYEQKLFDLNKLSDGLEAIVPELIRFPALDAAELKIKVANFIKLVTEDKL